MSQCYYHQGREAVGQCQECGKFLCYDCFNLTVGHLCYDCAQALNRQRKKEMLFNLVTTIVLTAIWIAAFITMRFNSTVSLILLLIAGIYPARRMLTYISRRFFPSLIVTWFVYGLMFIIKLILAFICSIFMLPYYIIKLIISIVKYTKENKNYKLIEENHAHLMGKQ